MIVLYIIEYVRYVMKLIFQKNYIGDDSSQGTQEDMLV
jgi:hypothetical protein